MDFGIYFENNLFMLQTEKTSYVIALSDGYPGNLYYGKKIDCFPSRDNLRESEYSYLTGGIGEKCTFMDGFPFEYGVSGTGDFRTSCLEVISDKGFTGCELKYRSHKIYKGKKKKTGLPSAFGKEEDTVTLEMKLQDVAGLVEVDLFYSIFKGSDVIVRSADVRNISESPVRLGRVLSSSVEFGYDDQDIITLNGSWAREHIAARRPIGYGRVSASSQRGISSHQENPFMAVVSGNATETEGDAYGTALIYSGNFIAEAELTQHDTIRAVIGINPYGFEWLLAEGETFESPEAAFVRSFEGIGGMSREFHTFIREHLIKSKYQYKDRPVVINNWEATYFNFNEKKLLDIARRAHEAGIEMLVMDDGWFGKRYDETTSLGDWTPNPERLPDGVKGLCEKINAIGLDMGIWFEPEMISPDSDLYRAHPDWAFKIPGREPAQARNQYVLDITREEVREYVYESIAAILRDSNIRYVKWDMNRPLTDIGSTVTRPGEIYHRYVLGLYEIMDRLITEFPDLLLENCSSGGGRFDMGMLYYSPQIWCSDDTDAIERLDIQEGTSLVYPPSSMGSHVSVCPNHLVGRTTDLKTRGYVALAGTFGYELDITKISDEEIETVKEQVVDYKRFGHLVREGDYYRLSSGGNVLKTGRSKYSYSWCFVSKDKREVLFTYIRKSGAANVRPEIIKIAGLRADLKYVLDDGREFSGSELMNMGFLTDRLWGDGQGRIYHFTAKES
ncbi:MAG: alpha-galactosidase [Eubacterium sp.]|nr:alpha-galactosidase [Eubacterium sp.]